MERFTENNLLFISYWKDKEPNFIQYNQSQYSKRASKQTTIMDMCTRSIVTALFIHSQVCGLCAIDSMTIMTVIQTCLWRG